MEEADFQRNRGHNFQLRWTIDLRLGGIQTDLVLQGSETHTIHKPSACYWRCRCWGEKDIKTLLLHNGHSNTQGHNRRRGPKPIHVCLSRCLGISWRGERSYRRRAVATYMQVNLILKTSLSCMGHIYAYKTAFEFTQWQDLSWILRTLYVLCLS